MSSGGGRTGRPIGDVGNRDKILSAAREQFASRGFRGATMRAIAAQAGTDVALVAHYFGNKEGLFTATLELPEGAVDVLFEALSGPLPGQGERLARGYLGLWESTATGEQMRVLIHTAMTNDAAGIRIGDLLGRVLGHPDAARLLQGREVGFCLAMSHLLGTAVARHLIRLPPLVHLSFDDLVARVAPVVQFQLGAGDGSAAPPGRGPTPP